MFYLRIKKFIWIGIAVLFNSTQTLFTNIFVVLKWLLATNPSWNKWYFLRWNFKLHISIPFTIYVNKSVSLSPPTFYARFSTNWSAILTPKLREWSSNTLINSPHRGKVPDNDLSSKLNGIFVKYIENETLWQTTFSYTWEIKFYNIS